MKIETILTNVIIFLIILLAYLLGNMYSLDKLNIFMKNPVETAKLTDNSNCSGMNLIMTSYCLNKQVNEFFKFNISNINKSLTGSELKTQGGVCWQYAKYYIDNIENEGYLGQNISFWGNEKIGHSIALVYDKNMTSYCILDQQSVVGCQELEVNISEVTNES